MQQPVGGQCPDSGPGASIEPCPLASRGDPERPAAAFESLFKDRLNRLRRIRPAMPLPAILMGLEHLAPAILPLFTKNETAQVAAEAVSTVAHQVTGADSDEAAPPSGIAPARSAAS